MTHSPSRLPKVNTEFFEKYICRDINPSIHFLKFSNKLKQREIVPAHHRTKMKSKLFKEDYIGISIHKAELVNCGSSDQPANL